jgi:hypothetical protein
MNKQSIMKNINKLKFKTMKNAPQILIYAGAIGAIGAAVMACKATLKVSEIIDRSQESIKIIRDTQDDETAEYTQEDARKDLAIVYVSRGLDLAKLYAPAVIVGGISIAAMIKSHKILSRRNAALAAAFTTASESFAKYRKAVVDRYGERVDHELRHNIKAEKVSVTDENGKTKKETVDVIHENLYGCSDYARFFDESCDGWSNDPEYNLMFLKAQQQHANDKLIAQGYLFLSDVYNMLGILESKASRVVGWVYNPDNPVGDNYVDFGIYDVMVYGYRNDYANETISEERREFVNGYRPSILLDFNVDGNIWELM